MIQDNVDIGKAVMSNRRSSSRLHRVSIENNDSMVKGFSPRGNKIKEQHDERDNNNDNNNDTNNNIDNNIDTSNDDKTQSTTVPVEFDEGSDVEVYPFNGVNYTSYQDMVNAKRRRNQQILQESGLLSNITALRGRSSYESQSSVTTVVVSKRGLQAKRHQQDTHTASHQPPVDSMKRRKSSRLLGIESDGLYIDEERAGHVTVAGSDGTTMMSSKNNSSTTTTTTSTYNTTSVLSNSNSGNTYRDRINDGSPISISDAIEYAGTKWMTDTSIMDATSFVQNVFVPSNNGESAMTATTTTTVTTTYNSSPTKSMATSIVPMNDDTTYHRYDPNMIVVDAINCNDVEQNVAKLCPDRIYSMTFHPSTLTNLIVCAGDKSGHVGIWNVQENDNTPTNGTEIMVGATVAKSSTNRDGVHLFKPHSSPVCCLQWTGSPSTSSNSNHLVSASYDGTIRMLDVNKEQFIEIFATYNTEDQYKNQFGYGIEQQYGKKFWTQHICIDPTYNESSCFFLSTSVGTAMHIDLRSKNHITFHEELSEKKINTISLHPNGHSLISGGLDNIVALWDVRTLGNSLQSSQGSKKVPQPIAHYNCGRSINSVYFSPSGKYAVSTTMANKLDIFEDIHLSNGSTDDGSIMARKKGKNNVTAIIQPTKSIRHDNMTGRWLTTFQAIFHPQLDLFVVGSMRRPRCIELFDPSSSTEDTQDGLLRTIQGDGLTAVASRLAFHPRTDQLIVCGGNSSGRVTIVRQ